MDKYEIIRMAREAGFARYMTDGEINWKMFERFAALVAEPWIETNKELAKEIIELKKQAEQEPIRLQCTTCGTVYANGVPPQVEQEPVCCETYGCAKPCPKYYAAPVIIEAAVLAEREECAKACETDELCCKCGDECAAAIRARG